MGLKPKAAVALVSAFLVLAVALSLSILRLGGLIDWPGRTVAILILVLLLAPIAYLLVVAMVSDSEGEETNGWLAWLKLFFG